MLFDVVDEDGVVLDDEVLLLFDDDEPELPFDDVERKRLKMQRMALESPSPMVERYSRIIGIPKSA